jgi:hypothetical protein
MVIESDRPIHFLNVIVTTNFYRKYVQTDHNFIFESDHAHYVKKNLFRGHKLSKNMRKGFWFCCYRLCEGYFWETETYRESLHY